MPLWRQSRKTSWLWGKAKGRSKSLGEGIRGGSKSLGEGIQGGSKSLGEGIQGGSESSGEGIRGGSESVRKRIDSLCRMTHFFRKWYQNQCLGGYSNGTIETIQKVRYDWSVTMFS